MLLSQTILRDELVIFEKRFREAVKSQTPLLDRIMRFIVNRKGKQLRPMFVLLSAKLCGSISESTYRAASLVELLHTATLVHDDVVDESLLRRGLASANAIFGNKASVLVGDFLFARAFQLMVEDGSLKVLEILSRASATIAEGEVLQLVTQNDLTTTEDRYLDVLRGKTAALFAAACQVGGVVADCTAEIEAALASYGMNLGMAFQLVDDALDYVADQAKLGKTVGDDFREGKITLPVLRAYQNGSEAERAFWRRTIEESEQTDADLDEALRLIAAHNTIAATLDRAQAFATAAKQDLAFLPASPIRDCLLAVADYTVRRGN